MADANGYTPSEAIIMGLLNDGHPHRPDEIKFVLKDPAMKDSTLRVALCNLRRRLRLFGQDIVNEKSYNVLKYRLVRTVASHARTTELE